MTRFETPIVCRMSGTGDKSIGPRMSCLLSSRPPRLVIGFLINYTNLNLAKKQNFCPIESKIENIADEIDYRPEPHRKDPD